MSGDEIRPFLATLASSPSVPRPFAATLQSASMPTASSPWSPQPVAASTPAVDVETIRAAATTEGRAAGQRETDALRARLAALAGELERAREANQAQTAEVVAEIAVAVIEAWVENTERKELFAPIVRGWLQKTGDGGGATARVHPSDVAAMREVIGDAMIAVEGDAGVKPGDVRVRGTNLDTTHAWSERLAELRAAIATALQVTP